MTHPILNRVPTVVFRPVNDDGPQQLGDAFGPRLAVLRHRSRTRVSAFGAIAIAEWFVCFAVCVFIGVLLATGGAL